MKTAAFVLEEEQIRWIEEQALKNGVTTKSAIARKVFAEAMQRCEKQILAVQGLDGELRVNPISGRVR